MRKRTLSNFFDNTLWYLIYLFPLIAYLFLMLSMPSQGTSVIDLSTFFNNLGLGFITNNIILDGLRGLFGVNGILPLFSTDSALYFMVWFICAFLVHLAVDFLLFIPRLAHKWLSVFCKDE